MDSNSTVLNLSKICRVCLLEMDGMHSIFSEISLNELDSAKEPTYICEILMSISSVRVLAEDGLPLLICTSCVALAQSAYNFQQQCNRSQEVLEAYVRQLHSNDCLHPDDIKIVDNVESDDDLKFINLNLLDTNDDFLSLVDGFITPSNKNVTSKIVEGGIKNCNPKEVHKCGSTIKNKKKYITIQENMDDNNKSYGCYHCGRKYKHLTSLKTHLRSHTSERPYVCKICERGFNENGALKYHLLVHTGEQPFECKICGKRYRQAGTLTAHMRVHTGHKPFLCSVCGRGFRQAPDLSYHMRTHTEERPYMCYICGKTMRMQCHLVQHIRMHTGEKPFQCNQCEKSFPSTTRLKRHTIIHTGLKPYTCDVCDKSFNRLNTLKVHAKVHTDERPYVCSFCGKAFSQAHALRGHLNTHLSAEVNMDKNKKRT